MKPETQIRNLNRALREEHRLRLSVLDERNLFRARATKAEQEVVEWKRRFDDLLLKCRDFAGTGQG